MNRCKKLLLAGYYYGTLPWRCWAMARRCARGTAPVMVLFYHRVADSEPNDWTISTRQFARHIRWLARQFEPVSLAEAQRRIASGCNRRPTFSITLDDGYADNCRTALPLLIRAGIPVTYFVSVANVLHGIPFPHDVEAGRPLPPNTLDELRALSQQGVEIGAHTRTHADLGKVKDPQQLTDELITARGDLQDALGVPVRYFAFPYGQRANISRAAFRLARQAGYQGVCSAYGGYNFPGSDSFHLRRIHGDACLVRLKNWLTVDPRKLPLSSPLDCEQPAGRPSPAEAKPSLAELRSSALEARP